jgi:phosphatidylglycerophosphate synthase
MPVYQLKNQGRELVKPFLRPLLSVHPNTITWTSLLFAAATGVCLYSATVRWPLLLVPVFILARMACNLLDGMVAIERRITSAKGEALQDLVDRLGDFIMIAGAALSSLGNTRLGIVAIALMLVSSYAGILKKAVGGTREYGGLLGKGDRYLLVGFTAIVQYFWSGQIQGLSALAIMLMVLIAGGMVTTIQRYISIQRIDR